jgi:hypothetical protein
LRHLGQRIGKTAWMGEPENVSVGHGVSLLQWRSGGGRVDTMTTPLKLRRGLAVLIALGCQCSLVNAQEQRGISGLGAERCAILTARVTAGANPNDTAALLTWIEGFISGLNMNAENDFYYDLTSIPSEQQTAQILTYCRNRPSEPVMNATLNLAQSFLARKPVHPR